jgi:hypothetical protein
MATWPLLVSLPPPAPEGSLYACHGDIHLELKQKQCACFCQEEYGGSAAGDVGDGRGIVCDTEHMPRALIGEWAGDWEGNVPSCAPILPLLEAVSTSFSVSLQEGRNMKLAAAVKSDSSHPPWLKETWQSSRKMGKFPNHVFEWRSATLRPQMPWGHRGGIKPYHPSFA